MILYSGDIELALLLMLLMGRSIGWSVGWSVGWWVETVCRQLPRIVFLLQPFKRSHVRRLFMGAVWVACRFVPVNSARRRDATFCKARGHSFGGSNVLICDTRCGQRLKRMCERSDWNVLGNCFYFASPSFFLFLILTIFFFRVTVGRRVIDVPKTKRKVKREMGLGGNKYLFGHVGFYFFGLMMYW